MSDNLEALDTVQIKLSNATALIELLISNFEGTIESGNFELKAGITHNAHAALGDFVSDARAAAKLIKLNTTN